MTPNPDPSSADDAPARITIAIPSLNQGAFIDAAIRSIVDQPVPTAIHVMDAGSTDQTMACVARWRDRIDRLRSHPDGGQAAAINEGLQDAATPYVAWLNADDEYLPGGLQRLVAALEANPDAPFAYGRTRLEDGDGMALGEYSVEAWDRDRFARKCFVSQPATLMRSTAWQRVGGLDPSLHMALDYDLWWRLIDQAGAPVFVDHPVALARFHPDAKTMSRPMDHYREAMSVVRRHYGRVPVWWWLKMPASVGARKFFGRTIGKRALAR